MPIYSRQQRLHAIGDLCKTSRATGGNHVFELDVSQHISDSSSRAPPPTTRQNATCATTLAQDPFCDRCGQRPPKNRSVCSPRLVPGCEMEAIIFFAFGYDLFRLHATGFTTDLAEQLRCKGICSRAFQRIRLTGCMSF